jgi:hypothetical protein
MRQHIAQNEDKSRRAVVTGRKVDFYFRPTPKGKYTAPRKVWFTYARDHEEAVRAADKYVVNGKLPVKH